MNLQTKSRAVISVVLPAAAAAKLMAGGSTPLGTAGSLELILTVEGVRGTQDLNSTKDRARTRQGIYEGTQHGDYNRYRSEFGKGNARTDKTRDLRRFPAWGL